MRNAYPGTCYRCGTWCAAGDGHFERHKGGWRVQHATCAIECRGLVDPDRDAELRERMMRFATRTGQSGQRARRWLRENSSSS